MTERTDYDSPWKNILEHYLPDFMAFFFPVAHAEIDWAAGYAFLDKELQQVTRDAEIGRRLADKLVQVWRRDGADAWVLIHIEIQSQDETAFAERMFVYHYRLFDRYRRQVVSLAVLGDEEADWRPDSFGYDLWGCRIQFVFPAIKLLEYRTQRTLLEESRNPFAIVVLAHLVVQDTRRDMATRAQVKFALARRLYEQGYSRQAVQDLYQFIDWLVRLPDELEQQVWLQIKTYEEEQQMTYITTAERFGRAQGLAEGRAEGRALALDGIVLVLEMKFGESAAPVIDAIRQVTDLAILEAVIAQIKTAQSLEDVQRVLAPPTQ